MLKRKIYSKLLDWKNKEGHNCLMVKGARQVGKTFIIRQFGKKEYKSFIEINFIKQKEYKDIFSGDLSADEIFKRLTAYIRGVELIPGNTLIFLDEIQNCRNARTSLKFLAEDGRYDIIASGSLLGLTYAENGDYEAEEPTSIPTGYEEFLTMYSLDFEEFLWAEGYNDESISVIKEYYDKEIKVPAILNDKFQSLFKEFVVVGGMPEVVNDYIEHHDYNRTSEIQEKLLEDYKMDISKHAKGAEKVKVQKCYDAIPKQLAKEIKKFQYSTVEKGQTRKKYGGSIQWLKDSALVNVCYNTCEPYVPLIANSIEEQFKVYINDTGLLCAMYGPHTRIAILNGTLMGNAKGGIYENVIADCLTKRGYNLHYYKPDDTSELEFLIEKDGGVIPIEVKAGNAATKSLNNFIEKYKPKVAYKFIDGNVGVVDQKFSLPHYMIMFI